MAVTLTQISQDLLLRKKRAPTLPLDIPYNPSEIPIMPQHQQIETSYSAQPREATVCSTKSVSQSCEFQPFYQTQIVDRSSVHQQLPTYEASNKRSESQTLHKRYYSSSSTASITASPRSSESSYGSASWTSIEPDPLPPHSNPQALTQTQSRAFTSSSPIPAMYIGKDEVWDSADGEAVFRILREVAHVPSHLSTKSILTVNRSSTGIVAGSVQFPNSASNAMDLTVNSRKVSISHSGVLHNRWTFQSTTGSREKLCWKKDRSTGGALLEDLKRSGRVVARMKGDLLTFEQACLSSEAYDEVVLSAIAIAEVVRRHT